MLSKAFNAMRFNKAFLQQNVRGKLGSFSNFISFPPFASAG